MSIEQIKMASIATTRASRRRPSGRSIGLLLVAATAVAAGTAVMLQSVTPTIETTERATATFSAEAVTHSRALNESVAAPTTARPVFSLDAVLASRAINEVDQPVDAYTQGAMDARALNQVQGATEGVNYSGVEHARALNEPEPGPAASAHWKPFWAPGR